MMDEADAVIAALWILFTWGLEHGVETNPFLRAISATPGCGKSTLFKGDYASLDSWAVVG
jgi:hypothetical protein